jgi:hypothetical protein
MVARSVEQCGNRSVEQVGKKVARIANDIGVAAVGAARVDTHWFRSGPR